MRGAGGPEGLGAAAQLPRSSARPLPIPALDLLRAALARYEGGAGSPEGGLTGGREARRLGGGAARTGVARGASPDLPAPDAPLPTPDAQRPAPDAQLPTPDARPPAPAAPAVQNTFNVTVHMGRGADEPDDDLADRLTRILVEQARRHGIDV